MLGKKKYVVVEEKEYNRLLIDAARGDKDKKLSAIEAKKYAYKLIDQWSKEK